MYAKMAPHIWFFAYSHVCNGFWHLCSLEFFDWVYNYELINEENHVIETLNQFILQIVIIELDPP